MSIILCNILKKKGQFLIAKNIYKASLSFTNSENVGRKWLLKQSQKIAHNRASPDVCLGDHEYAGSFSTGKKESIQSKTFKKLPLCICSKNLKDFLEIKIFSSGARLV